MWSVIVPSIVCDRVMRKYDAAVSTMKLAICACGSTITVADRFESGSMRQSSPNVAPGVSDTTFVP